MNSKVKKTLKFFLYFFGKILAVAIAVWVALFAFNTAMNTSNVQVLVKDAFAKRASVILEPLENSDTVLLSKIFTQSFLQKTRLDEQEDNKYYKVMLYSQRTDVKTSIVFPSAKKAVLAVTDVVEDVRATLVNEDAPDFKPKESLIGSGVYQVTVIKDDVHGWLIDDIELVEEITPEIVRPLPVPEPTATEGETPEGSEQT